MAETKKKTVNSAAAKKHANREKQNGQSKGSQKPISASQASGQHSSSTSNGTDSIETDQKTSLSGYYERAQTIKAQISAALDSQAAFHEQKESLADVEQLRNNIMSLTGTKSDLKAVSSDDPQQVEPESTQPQTSAPSEPPEAQAAERTSSPTSLTEATTEQNGDSKQFKEQDDQKVSTTTTTTSQTEAAPAMGAASNCFEPLTARLDPTSRVVALRASLERHFGQSPEMLEPICRKLVHLTCQMEELALSNAQQRSEIAKLTSIKAKLGELCRELQRANSEMRVDSLELVRAEQRRAKEQAAKIQETLAGVMKLFEENQSRNLALKSENLELQSKLRSLLEHCGSWEKCVETTLKQRDLENKLVRAEMARLQLVQSQEAERLLRDKQQLMAALEAMKAHQGRIETKESQLRAELAEYAGKYNECQEIINKGLAKFQTESRRMMKQIERSRQDYLQLLAKYEASNNKIKTLLEEKQRWALSVGAANKKVEALERLCRSLKADNDQLRRGDAAVADTGKTAAIQVEANKSPAPVDE